MRLVVEGILRLEPAAGIVRHCSGKQSAGGRFAIAHQPRLQAGLFYRRPPLKQFEKQFEQTGFQFEASKAS